MTSPLVFIDTETTGVHPGRRAWEVAMIRREPDGEQRELALFVEDLDLSNADPFGLQVGRFYERHPRYRTPTAPELPTAERHADYSARLARGEHVGHPYMWPAHKVAVEVERWTRGAHLVGAVVSFDAVTLDDMLRRYRLIPAWHYHLVDVEAMAVGYLHAVRKEWEGDDVPDIDELTPPWSSAQLSTLLGVRLPRDAERHTALGDARWAMRMYDAMAVKP